MTFQRLQCYSSSADQANFFLPSIHKLFNRLNSPIMRTSQSNQTDARAWLTAHVIAQSDGYVGNKICGQTASRQQ